MQSLEAEEWANNGLTLRTESASHVDNATTSAENRSIGIQYNRQPLPLQTKTQVLTGEELYAATKSEGKAGEVRIHATGNMGCTDTSYNVRSCPLRPLIQNVFVGEISVILIDGYPLSR